MAHLHPFRALRPAPAVVQEVACVPYDVIDVEEAHALAKGKPLSFLHVIRPEIDLPDGTDEHDDAVYDMGAENLRQFAESSHALKEAEPAVYVYRLVMDGRAQTGIYGCVSVEDYDNNVILKHEKTRPVKEDDRTRHILTQRAHAEPVMLTFRSNDDIQSITDAAAEEEPIYDFTADDGVRHTIWKVAGAEQLVDAFGLVEKLYVADGHHRCKAASRAAEDVRNRGENIPEANYFPAVLFPMDEMNILAYNRVVYQLRGDTTDFMEELRKQFDVESGADPIPEEKGEVCIYFSGEWHRLTLPPTRRESLADALDVARLNEYILEPLLGITDPRRDENIGFVGGIRGTEELENLVDSGRAALAFSVYPTSIEELVAISDAGLLMPPKSTWFEPKLRSGLLVHQFD